MGLDGLEIGGKSRLAALLKHFGRIKDPREPWRGALPLPEVLLVVVCGSVADCDDDAIAAWRKAHLDFRGVEERRGGLGPVGITPFPLPTHQTGRADFPHPASRPASPQSTRRGAKMDPTSSDHTELPEHDRIGETPGASRRHLVAGSAFALT